jgi:hypothetical protein
MPVICPQCGTNLGNGCVGPCPKCGYTSLAVSALRTNYSGIVAVTGSTSLAFKAIINAREMLASVAESDQIRAPFIQPIIEKLDMAAEETRQQEIRLASTQKTELNEYQKKIEEYRELINKGVEESEFQKFFEENPPFLDPKVKDPMPKKSFGGEHFPDFLLLLHNVNYLVVEIEKPSDRLFNQKGDPTAELSHAQQQVRDCLKWAIEWKEFLRGRGCPNISADNTRGLVVIGKSSSLASDELDKLENLNAEVRSRYEIKTFDRILAENEAILANLKKSV